MMRQLGLKPLTLQDQTWVLGGMNKAELIAAIAEKLPPPPPPPPPTPKS